MSAARERADEAAAHAIAMVEQDVFDLLGNDRFLDAPELGGRFRGYRVGDGSVFAALPLKQAKLAIDGTGLLVVVTTFGPETHHVQRAPRSMVLARVLAPYIEAMKTALERHAAACEARGVKFENIRARAGRICAALSTT